MANLTVLPTLARDVSARIQMLVLGKRFCWRLIGSGSQPYTHLHGGRNTVSFG